VGDELTDVRQTDRQTDTTKLYVLFVIIRMHLKTLCGNSPYHSCLSGLWLKKAAHSSYKHPTACLHSVRHITRLHSVRHSTRLHTTYQHAISHLNHLLTAQKVLLTQNKTYMNMFTHFTVSKHSAPVEADCWNSQRTRHSPACMEPCQLVTGAWGSNSWGSHPSVVCWEPCE
jgi:hypothetical protein